MRDAGSAGGPARWVPAARLLLREKRPIGVRAPPAAPSAGGGSPMSHQAARPRRSLPCRVVVRVVAPDGGHLAQDPVAVAVLLAAGQIEELAHRLRLGEDLPLGVNLAQHPLPPADP